MPKARLSSKVMRITSNRLDPTRTGTIRIQFRRMIRARYKGLIRELIKLIRDDDAFGLLPLHGRLVSNDRWRYRTKKDKVAALTRWLESAALGSGIQDLSLVERFVITAFYAGARRSYDAARPHLDKSTPTYISGRNEFLRLMRISPDVREQLDLLVSQVHNDLRDAAQRMTSEVAKIVADGLSRNSSSSEITSLISNAIEKGSKRRAESITHDALIKAHAEGQLEALERLGIQKVQVAAEWSTVGDDRVCPLCQPLEAIVLSISEARGLIPRHPNCRCSWKPVFEIPEGEKKKLKLSDTTIRKAIKTSAKKEDDTWAGRKLKVSKKRPLRMR